MMRMLRGAAVAVTILVVATFASERAAALSCAPPAEPAVAVADVDAVFRGKAVSPPRGGHQTFEIVMAYKGGFDAGERVRVRVGDSVWASSFAIGDVHAIAASRVDGTLRVGPCPIADGGAAALVRFLAEEN